MLVKEIEELDLHWTDEDPSFGIASDGVFCKDMDEIVRRITEVKDTVKKINLHNQPTLTEIPSVFEECTLLEELNITHTKIKEIPDFLFTLPNLKILSCCCRELLQPPKGIDKAQKLEKLHIRIKENWNYPEGITALSELKSLSADVYSDAPLPKDMGALKKLEELTLSIKFENGTVHRLPDSFSKHPALKKLSVGDHIFKNHKAYDLEKTAQILASCPAFESLKLYWLTVGKGHKKLSMLAGLKELELRHLIVEGNLFDSITGMKNLEKLDIWGSELKLSELPDIFENFKGLKTFSFAGNFVYALPPSIYSLTNLTTLEIGSTGITALDEKIGNLQSLEKLHIFDNMLETLPNAVFSLPRLSILNIEDNIIRQRDISAIREKLNALRSKGQKIELMDEGQGRRHTIKKLRSLKDADQKKLNRQFYFRVCIEAAKTSEIGNAFKYIRDDLLTDYEYIQVCLEAALHNISPDFLKNLNMKRLNRKDYERICWAAILHYPPVIINMIEPAEEFNDLAADVVATQRAKQRILDAV